MRGHNKYAGANGNIALPPGVGAQLVKIDVKAHGGPHAQPIVQALPTGNGLEVHIWGGLSKLEEAAIQLAAGFNANPENAKADPADIATHAAIQAEMVLAQCHNLVQKRMQEQKEQTHEDHG